MIRGPPFIDKMISTQGTA